jgi:GDPmannose 4,6-dehydratase
MAFVTRKISSAVARIHLGLEQTLVLGNLDAERDWGYTPDYVQAMWLMLGGDIPGDFVISSGSTHSVREFVEAAFSAVNLDYRDYVKTSSEFFRENDPIPLCGNSARIHNAFGWRPAKGFAEIVREMVEHDLALMRGA